MQLLAKRRKTKIECGCFNVTLSVKDKRGLGWGKLFVLRFSGVDFRIGGEGQRAG